jgi:CubicO group peptidase (beta-lactamase class C family)
LKRIIAIIIPLIVWTAFIAYGFIDGFLLKPITSDNSAEAFIAASKEKIEQEFVGNFVMTLIENGEVADNYFFAVDQAVNENTMFPVASISKWVTSFGIMNLVEQGKLDLDKPIDDYLTRWQLPKSEFDNRKVNIRTLLSHSSGLVDDLGYSGFAQNETPQTIEESLTKASDSPYSEGIAMVGFEPGSKYMYSGAGYTILQLLIEEVTSQPFQEYMKEAIFQPLEMNHSTFVPSENPTFPIAKIYKDDGSTRPAKKFTALAAASLYTSTSDLSKFLKANVSTNNILSPETIHQMAEAETFINDIGIYGLGPHLYSQNHQTSNIIGHDGSGNNAINTAARIDLQSKDGIIILETGNHNIASNLADEWMFWKAGIADYVVMTRNKSYLLKMLIIGYLVIVGFLIFVFRRRKNLG